MLWLAGEEFDPVFDDMKAAIVRLLHFYRRVLQLAAKSFPHGKFFAMYRFDFIVDENLKPWLCEVNQSPYLGVEYHEHLNTMYLRMLYGALNLVGLGPGQIRDPSRKPELRHIMADEHAVDIGWRVCSGKCAEGSCDDECRICRHCRSEAETEMLMQTVAEHRNGVEFTRLFPLGTSMAAREDLKNVTMESKDDQLLHAWLRERCSQEHTWC